MRRRTKWLIAGGVILALIIIGAVAGGGSDTTSTSATTTPPLTLPDTTSMTTTAPVVATTEPNNKPTGDAVVAWLKDQSMPDDPMMAPLTGAKWTGDELTLIYQGESDLAANLCNFTAVNLPGNLGVKTLGGVFVQRGDGKLLARTQVTRAGCKAY
jgi:hypothetical protein